MKLFIPAIGDRIVLLAPWSFTLYLESRNMKFAKEVKLVDEKANNWGVYTDTNATNWGSKLKTVKASLPKGTMLECDRVYIRTQNKSRANIEDDYDSITWKVVKNDKAVRNQRFWVKLPDCYDIECEIPSDGLYRDRIKVFKVVHES